jgi:hypothetical protein
MSNLVCIKHPKYEGKGTPVLSCKTCCGLYIAEIKRLNPPKENINDWLDRKAREANNHGVSK